MMTKNITPGVMLDVEVDEGVLFLRPHCQRVKGDYSSASSALTVTSQEAVSAHLGTSKDGAATTLLSGSISNMDDSHTTTLEHETQSLPGKDVGTEHMFRPTKSLPAVLPLVSRFSQSLPEMDVGDKVLE